MVKYRYTILYVENVERSIHFYSSVFGFAQKMITPEKDYGEVKSGETLLSFAVHDLAKTNFSGGYESSHPDKKPMGIELCFIAEQIEELLEKVEAEGGTILQQPLEKPWGQTVAYARDLDGFLIELGTPMAEE